MSTPLHLLSAGELHEQFMSGKLTAVHVAEYFLKRIHALDPELGSFLSVFDDRVLEQAKALDLKKKSGQRVGSLAGIPIAIKDNIHVKGEITTCASKFLTNYKAPFHATAVERLLAEDALIIGKTNLDEFAMGSSTENSALQRTRNPWDLNCCPGGSSGGSAAAVAARLCPVALGSDTGGSVRQPASLCGIVGYKPTYGRVSRFGLVAYGSSLDQIGVLATTTKDAAKVMEVIGGQCEKDSTCLPEPKQNYLSAFDGSLKGLKIGVPWQFLNDLADEPKQLFERSIDVLKQQGAVIVDVDLTILKYSIPVYYILATAEASTNLARFDGIRYGVRSSKAKTLDEVYDFSKEEGFGKEVKRRILLGTFVLSSGYQDAYYKKAQKVRALMIRHYEKAFKECDLIATPVSPFAAFAIGEKKDPLQLYLEDIYTLSINLAGLPAISVPAGFTSANKPVGLQFIGPQTKDREVMRAADAFEHYVHAGRQVPAFAGKEAP